ncbi:hypothetical protein ABPG75_012684 [Micractinium tetrahymenae]
MYGSPDRRYTNQASLQPQQGHAGTCTVLPAAIGPPVWAAAAAPSGIPPEDAVFARWYRPPELLYGSTCYGPGVDIWAAGCIFAELLLRRPWFVGDSDVEVLTKIFMALGTPTDESWGGLRALPRQHRGGELGASDDALDLLSRMMSFDASRRITAADALQHRYFRTDPLPSGVDQLPKSLLGRGERPKLDSSDVAFFKKRKFDLDDALEEGENEQAAAS